MCSPREDFTRRPGSDTPVMCTVCFEWRALDELAVDPTDGVRVDMCADCWADYRSVLEQGREYDKRIL